MNFKIKAEMKKNNDNQFYKFVPVSTIEIF